MSFLNSTKVVKLPNHHNSTHEELRSESLNPERRTLLEARMWQNGQVQCRITLKYQVGRMAIRYIACWRAYLLVQVNRISNGR
jgi:hypothetical protein